MNRAYVNIQISEPTKGEIILNLVGPYGGHISVELTQEIVRELIAELNIALRELNRSDAET